jgi:hypothetical protein
VGLPSVILTPFLGAHDLLSVRHRGWPVEALLECVSDQGLGHGVVPTDPALDILQQLFPLFDQDTMLQDLGGTLFVELSLNDDEGLCAACEPSGLRLVNQEHLVEEVVEIRCHSLSRRVGNRRRFHVKLHDLKVGKGRRLTSPRG